METKLLIVADLGCLKIYRVSYNGVSKSPQFELIEDFDTHATSQFGHELTDEAGRFEGGNPTLKGLRVCGERHNIPLEQARRTIKTIADHIDRRVEAETNVEHCLFSAGKDIHRQILDQLDQKTRAKIVHVIPEDLTHTHQSRLLQHFSAQHA